ncbi:hypothetical protein OU800_16140 [Pseudomonas sp. GOM7]|uniref:hypothetical protein n=1 Tax=unclassified Pseudomonas TaxID=196821 RepID=UPI00227B4444|nr:MULTISPECIES: hypothetical protein [unclassified Pseudomonas]WAJ36141.1 hypothetical protein OU800_16140 [Pseudomonas sp. GOM7]
MIKHFLAVTAFIVVTTAHAAPLQTCLTNELEPGSITAQIALAAGNCYLAQASDNTQRIVALEYAHSWFLHAQALGASQASEGLERVERGLAQVAQENRYAVRP